jgi:hypothetical protein
MNSPGPPSFIFDLLALAAGLLPIDKNKRRGLGGIHSPNACL